jgi:hypothetical protein
MPDPWPLVSRTRQEAIDLYFAWVSTHYMEFSNQPMLCNWLPLGILAAFAAENGVRIALDYWRGHAPTDGTKRSWDVSRELLLDSHAGGFEDRGQFSRKIQGTVTAKMIGTLNTVPIDQTEARPGDLIVHDLGAQYWHVELITRVQGGVLMTQAGSTPAIAPKDHATRHTTLTSSRSVLGRKPRRWDFAEVFVGLTS